MPEVDDQSLYCQVKTAKGIFRDWTSVTVTWSAERDYMRFFQLELAEPSPGNVSSAFSNTAQRLLPGDQVDVALGGQPVIVNGRIKVRQVAYDANRHAVQVTGISKSGDINELSVNVPKRQFRNYTFQAIANTVLKPLGVGLSLVNPPSGADLPFPNVIVHTGESIGAVIKRLARMRGLWLWVDVDGTIMAGNPSSSSGATLEEGRNILAATSYIEDPAAENQVMLGQSNGSDARWGRSAAENAAKAKITTGGNGAGKSIITVAEEPATAKELQTRADHEVSALQADIHRDVITHRGWFRPGAGTLWKVGDSASVKSPMLYPFVGGVQNLKVWGVSCTQNDESGTVCSVELVNEATFSQRFPDASKSSPYNPGGEQAQPLPFFAPNDI